MTHAHLWETGAWAVLGGSVLYLVSLVYPWWPHRRCHGTGKLHARWPAGATRDCTSGRCASGRVVRLGVRLLQPARARRLMGR